ncbi:MAG: gliding motility lipoprotein GldB [Bacteroidota bacterium]
MKRLSKFFRTLISIILVLWLGFMVKGCKKGDETEKKINALEVNLSVARFDRDFATTPPEKLPELKVKYPYLFPAQYPDSIWINKLQDTLQLEIAQEVDKAFGTFDETSLALEDFYKHVTYYFPGETVPKVVTLTSDVNYENRVILADTLLLLGLDNYLGANHKFYQSVPRYIAKGLDKTYLVSDVAGTFSRKVVRVPRGRTFLAKMVYYGKLLYLKDKLVPQLSDAQKIGYVPEELDWAYANEEQIWRYFIENELLYSTNAALDARFLDPAPFSKFRLALDNQSPGRLGRFLGWQIVRAFVAKNESLTLQEVLDLPADEILKQSNYKPKR